MILTIITVLAIGFFIIEFEPLHIALDWIRQQLPDYKLITYILGVFTCWQCMTFWSGLIYTGNIYTAMIASLASVILHGWMQKK